MEFYKKLCLGISFSGSRFWIGMRPLWPRRGAGVGPGAEQVQARRGSRICFPVLPERPKRCSKTMEPMTRIRDLGCLLEGALEVKSNSLKSQILEGICSNFEKAMKTKFQHKAFCKKDVVLEIDFKIDAEQH